MKSHNWQGQEFMRETCMVYMRGEGGGAWIPGRENGMRGRPVLVTKVALVEGTAAGFGVAVDTAEDCSFSGSFFILSFHSFVMKLMYADQKAVRAARALAHNFSRANNVGPPGTRSGPSPPASCKSNISCFRTVWLR